MQKQQPRKNGFARILGRPPRISSVKAQLVEPAMLEAFGPAERIERPKSRLLFWNFVREDGKKNFTLFTRMAPNAKHSKIIVNLAAECGDRSFHEWVLDRLSAIDNGDLAPQFVGSDRFAITRAAR
jgi:hypothetical protein